jgi:hypothetical protein
MNEERRKIKIFVSSGGQHPLIYSGYVIDDKEDFLYLDDVKLGQIKINKSHIITEQDIGGGY